MAIEEQIDAIDRKIATIIMQFLSLTSVVEGVIDYLQQQADEEQLQQLHDALKESMSSSAQRFHAMALQMGVTDPEVMEDILSSMMSSEQDNKQQQNEEKKTNE